jgi:hypothetical protein
MQRTAKIQRVGIDSLPAAIRDSDNAELVNPLDDEPHAMKNSVVELQTHDHQTRSSFVDMTCGHTYDIKDGTLQVSVADNNGNGYVLVRVNTKRLFSNLGVVTTIPDVRSTVRTMKLLQTKALRAAGGHGTAQAHTGEVGCTDAAVSPGDDDDDNAASDEIRQQLATVVKREVARLAAYGPLQYVEVKHPKNGESTSYRVVLTKRDNAITFQFISIEMDESTGTTIVKLPQLVDAVGRLLKIGSEETEFASALTTLGTRSVVDDAFKVVGTQRSRPGDLELQVALPSDSFTGDTTCYASVGVFFILTTL